ncbi:MAG: hypothetical protein KatS3mg002_0657 [Candidatus Woesearchaeota archaeon]|nr:MAG: hypothetical protein KatS3mg002_0657 [Candidatus Woesearchaeota archaeon]
MLITHIEIKGHKNEKILFYGRNSHGLEIIEEEIYVFNKIFKNIKPVKPFAVSEPLSEKRLEEKIIDLKANEEFEKLKFETIKNEKDYLIYAEGNTKILKKLPGYFKIKPGSGFFSSTELLRKQLNFPFPIIKKKNNNWFFDRQMTLEEFLTLNSISLDSEFMHWEKEKKYTELNNTIEQKKAFLSKYNQEYTDNESENDLDKKIIDFLNQNKGKYDIIEKPMSISLAKNKKEIINKKLITNIEKAIHLSYLLGQTEEKNIELTTGNTPVKVIKLKNEEEIVKKLNKIIEEEDIKIIITQNGPKYDLPKLRDFKLEIFGKKPQIKSTSGFFYKTIIPGQIIIDLAAYSQNYFPWTIDNKYSTIVKLITGIDFEKSISYDEQTKLTIEALLGNEDSFEKMQKYDLEDVTGLSLTEKYILPMIYFKSKIAKTTPETINTTSKANWALNRYRFEHFLEGKGFWNGEKLREYNKFYTFKRFEEKTKTKTSNVEKNFVDASLYYLAPFTSIYREELLKNPDIKEAFEYIKTTSQLEKTDLILTIEEGYLMPYIFDSYFKKSKYEEEIIRKYKELTRKFPPLNYNKNYFCFKKSDSEKEEFKKLIKGLGIELSNGKLYNIKKGSFILYDGRNFYKKDIDAKGTLGFKTIYQEEIIHNFIEKLFKTGPYEAISIVSDFFKKLKNRELEREKMIYFKESMIKDYWDYSSIAQRQERIKAYISLGIKKGEKVAHFKTPKGHIRIEQFNKMPDDILFGEEMRQFLISEYIGKKEKERVKMSDNRIGKYILPLANFYKITKEELYDIITSGKNINKQYKLF